MFIVLRGTTFTSETKTVGLWSKNMNRTSLASNSEDEKKIKKAKTTAEKKRKDARPHDS